MDIGMKVKTFTLVLIITLMACGHDNLLPDSLKKNLIDFSTSESSVTMQVNGAPIQLDFGRLFGVFNKINVEKKHDTLSVDVHVELAKKGSYDGGIEFLRDTLFLYAKRVDYTDIKETVHSTLHYTISTNSQQYKEIEFKELK